MSEETGPRGTHYADSDTCKNESDHICPVCHPECEAVFRGLTDDYDPAYATTQAAEKQEAFKLPQVNDLDHIQIRLSGDWDSEALRNVALGFQAAAEAAKENGLTMEFIAVKKAAARSLISRGTPPFRKPRASRFGGRR